MLKPDYQKAGLPSPRIRVRREPHRAVYHQAVINAIIAYFLGIFGFPVLGGWLIVTFGKAWFLGAVFLFAIAELGLALVRSSRVRAG